PCLSRFPYPTLFRSGVYVVQALADLRPRPAAVDLLSDLVRRAREKVVLFASAFAEPARVKGKELLLAEQSRVELLADRVVAARAGSVGLEECREVLVRAGGRRAGFGDLLPKRRILHLSRHELSRVPRRCLRLADGALDIHARGEREVQVRLPVGDLLRHRVQPRAGRVGEVALRAQAME